MVGNRPIAAACGSAASSSIDDAGPQISPASSKSFPQSASVRVGHRLVEDVDQRRHVVEAVLDGLEAVVVEQLGPLDGRAERRPPARLGHVDDDPAVVGAAEPVAERRDQVVAVALAHRRPVDQRRREVGGHRPCRGGEEADVDDRPLTGALGDAQRGEHGGDHRHAGRVVALRRPRLRGDAAGLGHRVGDRRPPEERRHVEPGSAGVRADEAVPGQRGVHDAPVAGVDRRRVEAVAGLAERQQVAEEHVGPVDQRPHELGAVGAVEGHGDRALAAVVDVERVVDVGRPLGLARHVAHDVAGERLDLDDVGAHVGEDRSRARRRHPARDLDDAHTVERSGFHRRDCRSGLRWRP